MADLRDDPRLAEARAVLLAAMEVVRAWGNPGHWDNWVDLAGYAACGGELAKRSAGRDDG